MPQSKAKPWGWLAEGSGWWFFLLMLYNCLLVGAAGRLAIWMLWAQLDFHNPTGGLP